MEFKKNDKGLKKAKIVSNLNLNGDYFLMTINVTENYIEALPGQFVMLRADLRETPLLSRPFSIYSISRAEGAALCTLLYRVVGKTTRLLSRKKADDFVYILGPLGRGFDTSLNFEKAVLVAGGTGIAPISFLSELLMKRSKDVSFYYGAKSENDLLGLERLEKKFMGRMDMKICTEDCSRGEGGVVTNLLQKDIVSLDAHNTCVFACGPIPMLKSLKKVLSGIPVPVQVSLEERMACGIGACLACAVMTESGYARVCKEGPVFDLDRVELDR